MELRSSTSNRYSVPSTSGRHRGGTLAETPIQGGLVTHPTALPFVHQHRSPLVVIVLCLLLGCTPSDTRRVDQMPAHDQQVSSELIAFVSDREGSDALFVMRTDGSGVRRLTGELPDVSHPAWSADGQRIAFNAVSPSASDIYVINLDGSGLTKITSEAGPNFYPTWSPDGTRLAFSSNRDGDWDIYVMDVDGSDVRQLVDSPGFDDKPQWSPDGSRIGFATTRSGSPQLLAVDPDTGKEATLLPHPISGLNPAWSLDGQQLAFNVVTSNGFDIEVISADGHDRRSVVATDASDERPRWSPDGEQLTYYSDDGGSWEVYTVLIATGATQSLTDSPGFDGQPAWQPQTCAAGGLLSNLDQIKFGNQQAGLNAAKTAQGFANDPYNQMLAIEAQRRGIPLQTLAAQFGFAMPAAQAFATRTGTENTTKEMSGADQFAKIGAGTASFASAFF